MNRTRPFRDTLVFLAQCIVAGLALAFVLGALFPGLADRVRGRATVEPPVVAPGPPHSYRDAVGRAAPAVVSIYADKIVTERPLRLVPDPVLQRYSAIGYGPPRQRLERSLGSGVIVRDDGHVLTNHHVIAGAEDIRIVLQDGRVTDATLVGSDPETDLAVLRIQGGQLPALRLEDAPALQVGDVVLAIGNPFGLGQTVTQGIVSALGRHQLQLAVYEDFIQTDAAINRGNSGGALVNAEGRLVGINTAAFTQRVPDASGISFAIPVDTARVVLDQILAEGRVVRGWLGAEYIEAPPPPVGHTRGAVIAAVHPGGPADAAGLRAGDLVVALDGTPIGDPQELRRREAQATPGGSASLSLLRAGVPFVVELTLQARPTPDSRS
ncbi:MAG: S1C family serine protease [Lysobacteraceae bacterium]